MLVSLFPVAVSASRFDDVDDGKWYTEAIEFCDMNGYMAGTSENVFERNGTLTRAMFVTVLASIEGINTNYYAYNPCFSDVALGKWYSGAIAWAYAKDLASGLGDGTFGYKDPVTREQIAVFMLSYARYINSYHGYPDGILVNAYDRADLSVYDDEDSIHGWAKDAVSWAVAVGLISGTSETIIDPRGNCTRAQAAVIIQNFVLNVNESCNHEWVEPTCTEYGYCANCFIFNKSLAPHDFIDGACRNCPAHYDPDKSCAHTWIKNYCDENSFCLRCGETRNDTTYHNFVADEESELFIVCTECGYYTCAEEHVWVEPTCLEYGYCEICYELGEKELGHKLDSDGVCVNCGGSYDEEDKCFHVWIMPDCENDGFCLVCLKAGELSDGHEFEDGECVNCGKRECKHSWTEPTCTKDAYCTKCGETNPDKPATGHSYINGADICRLCRVYKSDKLTVHQNVIHNIQTRGISQSNVKKFEEIFVLESDIVSALLLMRSGDTDNVYAALNVISEGSHLRSEITLSESMTECPFVIWLTGSKENSFSFQGTADLKTGALKITSSEYGDMYDEKSALMAAELTLFTNIFYAEMLLTQNCDASLTDYGFEIGAIELS